MAARRPPCPHCNEAIDIRTLPHPSIVMNYRLCPACGGAFTVDAGTKRRQATALVLACVSLLFTGLLYVRGNDWLAPALVSYAVVGAIIYQGNKKVYFVPFDVDAGRSIED